MIRQQQILTVAAAITLLAIGGPAAASDNSKLAYASEVNTCVAEIGNHANYDDATRVLHSVVMTKNTFTGYVFTIDTSVYTESVDTAVREYASYCVARRDSELVRFRINEISI